MAFTRSPLSRITVFVVLLALPTAVFAGGFAKMTGGGSNIAWQIDANGYSSVQLRVSKPDGQVDMYEFRLGSTPSLSLQELGAMNGTYLWEMALVPNVPENVRKQFEAAREANDIAAAAKIMKEAGLENRFDSGAFTVNGGMIVTPERTEGAGRGEIAVNANRPGQIETLDQVIPDDLIVQGSLCAGLDCVNNESFGFDTIRLKENNLRIHFDDTSTQAGFPANDWRLIANDSASGGSSKFSIEDSTSAKTPFTITAGASTNSIFVDSTGRVGFRTSTPVLDLHVATSNTPAIRLEQNNTGGFTAQTWDIGANEANFFVRDVTGGSKLSLRIRPGAPTSSLDIAADGNVGIGVAGADAKLHVVQNSDTAEKWLIIEDTDDTVGSQVPQIEFVGNGTTFGFLRYGSVGAQFRSAADAALVTVANDGNVGIGTAAPGSDLVIANGATTSSINAGSAQFTVASSRTFKENIQPIATSDILEKIEAVPVVTYDFKDNGPKDRLGLIAEDFFTVFQRGDEKHIDGQDVQMALWLAVQQLTQENKALTERLNALEKELTQTPK